MKKSRIIVCGIIILILLLCTIIKLNEIVQDNKNAVQGSNSTSEMPKDAESGTETDIPTDSILENEIYDRFAGEEISGDSDSLSEAEHKINPTESNNDKEKNENEKKDQNKTDGISYKFDYGDYIETPAISSDKEIG